MLPAACMEPFQRFQESETRASTQERTCENCGSYVTKQFIRVFGGNDGSVYGCMNCSTGRTLREGGGRAPTPADQPQSSVDAD